MGGKHAKYLVQNKKALFIKCIAHTQLIVWCCFSNKSCDPVIILHLVFICGSLFAKITMIMVFCCFI